MIIFNKKKNLTFLIKLEINQLQNISIIEHKYSLKFCKNQPFYKPEKYLNINRELNIKHSNNTNSLVNNADEKERACDTLIMCIATTLNNGLRNGGGIGDVLRKPSSTVILLFLI